MKRLHQLASVAALSTLPVIIACALVGATEARADTCTMSPSTCDPYVVTIQQMGPDVAATAGGEFDLGGLTLESSEFDTRPFIFPSNASLRFWNGSLPGNTDDYYGFSVAPPPNFGPGSFTAPSGSIGPTLGISHTVEGPRIGILGVPTGYTSGLLLTDHLSSEMVFTNMTRAGLGVTPGTYVWTWGTARDQSFTLRVIAPSVASPSETPAPAALPLFATGLGGLGLLGWRRKRKVRASLLGVA